MAAPLAAMIPAAPADPAELTIEASDGAREWSVPGSREMATGHDRAVPGLKPSYFARVAPPISQVAAMLCRISLLSVVLCWSAAPAPAQLHKVFPWFHPAEPAIDSQVYVSRPGIRIDGRRIGILPFPARQGGEPVPPPFASYLRNALFVSSTPGSVVDVPDPAEFLAERERSHLSESRRAALALDHCKAARVNLMATGRIDALFRTASGGMMIKIRAQLWDVESRTPVWSGRVALNWTRRYSLEDCLLRAAITLVEEWTRAADRENRAGL